MGFLAEMGFFLWGNGIFGGKWEFWGEMGFLGGNGIFEGKWDFLRENEIFEGKWDFFCENWIFFLGGDELYVVNQQLFDFYGL